MSYPNVIFGSYGDEKKVAASAFNGAPLGTPLQTPDGSLYRMIQASATALVAGKLYQGEAQIADTMFEDILVTGSAAVGATAITITTGGSASVTKDQFKDGILFTASSANGGVGEKYRIRVNNSAANASTQCQITLYQTDPLVSAISGGTTKVGLRQNPYKNVLLTTADTVRVGPLAGIPPTAIPANSFGWIQRRGEATAFMGATLTVVGLPVTCGTVAAGEVSVWFAAASANNLSWATEEAIGYCLNSAGTAANFSLIYLTLE
ncbi:hypothetical protein LCGC14_1659840 [marine sediment metagenome]|uniref:Uncharacterized protein n=1 Tax=marine sediment metagenome TaxID=412755 RepID=A0A0F9HV72_9ZZZZ